MAQTTKQPTLVPMPTTWPDPCTQSSLANHMARPLFQVLPCQPHGQTLVPSPPVPAVWPGYKVRSSHVCHGPSFHHSCAILRYLAQKHNVADHWYPKDLQARTRVDEALAWFPGNLRCGAFFHSVSSPPFSQYILSLCVTATVNSKLLHQSFFSAHYYSLLASFPGPRPAFRRLQYGKAGEGLVHFLT